MKRLIGEIWKDEFLSRGSRYGGQWNIQFQNGVYNCYTRKQAEEWQRIIINDETIPVDKKISIDDVRTTIMKEHFPELYN